MLVVGLFLTHGPGGFRFNLLRYVCRRLVRGRGFRGTNRKANPGSIAVSLRSLPVFPAHAGFFIYSLRRGAPLSRLAIPLRFVSVSVSQSRSLHSLGGASSSGNYLWAQLQTDRLTCWTRFLVDLPIVNSFSFHLGLSTATSSFAQVVRHPPGHSATTRYRKIYRRDRDAGVC